jgi:WG containing repeat
MNRLAKGILLKPLIVRRCDRRYFQVCAYVLCQLVAIVWLLRSGSVAQSPAVPSVNRTDTDFPTPFEQRGKWGYDDRSGKVVISPNFSSAAPFSEGIAEVGFKGKIGWIGADGRFVIQPKYFKAGHFKEGVAWVVTRRPWTPFGTGEYGFALFGYVTYIDHSGKEIRRPFSAEQVGDFSEGLAAVRPGRIFGGCSENVGYLNTKGEWGIKTQFDDARDFSDGLAAVNKGGKCHVGGKWGYVDRDGKMAIPFRYDFASQFKNGHACVKEGGEWKRIDNRGDGTPIREDEC